MSNSVIIRRLYRSLLQTSKAFSSPHPNAAFNTSLLHRTGIDDGLEWDRIIKLVKESTAKSKAGADRQDEDYTATATDNSDRSATTRKHRTPEQARDLSVSYADIDDIALMDGNGIDDDHDFLGGMESSLEERKAPHRILFRRLLREAVTGIHGVQQMMFPSQVDTTTLKTILQREFRVTPGNPDEPGKDNDDLFDVDTRKQVAFLALRELNTKLHWSEIAMAEQKKKNKLGDDTKSLQERNRRQAAKDVSPVSLKPSDYLQPGTFLLAHPFLTGYFQRSVICILSHSEGKNGTSGGTYGLVVNKQTINSSTGQDRTLTEVLRTVPPELAEVFGESLVREGGPVHMSIQMVHSADSPGFGGTVLPMRPPDDMTSTALHSDRAVWYQGDIIQAAEAVSNGQMNRDDVCFYVGASCWEELQLESEIERGYWLPCKGPPEIALDGKCQHDMTVPVDPLLAGPKDDLWLSMMCAMGDDEANLAHMVQDDDQYDLSGACDNF